MATYAAPDGQPHGIAVLTLRREEADDLIAFLIEARRRGAITENTDLGDVVDAMEVGLEDSVYTVDEQVRAALVAACA